MLYPLHGTITLQHTVLTAPPQLNTHSHVKPTLVASLVVSRALNCNLETINPFYNLSPNTALTLVVEGFRTIPYIYRDSYFLKIIELHPSLLPVAKG